MGIVIVSCMFELSCPLETSLLSPTVCGTASDSFDKLERDGSSSFFIRSRIHDADENCGVYEDRGVELGGHSFSVSALTMGSGSTTAAAGESCIVTSSSFGPIGKLIGNSVSISRSGLGIARVM